MPERIRSTSRHINAECVPFYPFYCRGQEIQRTLESFKDSVFPLLLIPLPIVYSNSILEKRMQGRGSQNAKKLPPKNKLTFDCLDLDNFKTVRLSFISALHQDNQQREPREEDPSGFTKLQKLNFLFILKCCMKLNLHPCNIYVNRHFDMSFYILKIIYVFVCIEAVTNKYTI